jgi:hypothetical protein
MIKERFMVKAKNLDGNWASEGYLMRSCGCHNGINTINYFVGDDMGEDYCQVDPETIEPVAVAPIDGELCPNCKEPHCVIAGCNYCPNCGQRLDWSEK